MALLTEFVGGTYQALSPALAADEAINCFLETRRAEGSVKTRALYGTPGLKAFIAGTSAAGSSRCRGWFSQDGLTLVVCGTVLRRVNLDAGTTTVLGVIADNGEPVSFASNGKGGDQVAIVGGGQLKVLDTGAMTLGAAVTLPFADPVMVIFMDGYFLINQRHFPVVWFSALEDGENWDGLDFFVRSNTSDTIIGIGQAKSAVWAFGSATTTLFYDSGDADTPFLPYPGSATAIGCLTPWAIQKRGDVFTWLATGTDASAHVVKASGAPDALTLSTPPIDRVLRQCRDLSTAVALSYEQDGHAFYVVTLPDAPADVQTYAWDDTEGLWHARAAWDRTLGRFEAWRAAQALTHEGHVYVGDRASNALYELDLDTFADVTGILRSVRRIPYVSDDASTLIFLDDVELVAETGVGLATGQGAHPMALLRISRDAAQTWVSAGSRSLGAIGAYGARAIWHRLGRVRPDRLVLEVSMTDPVRRAWLGLRLRSTAGTGAL
jgi:hypothetical protein